MAVTDEDGSLPIKGEGLIVHRRFLAGLASLTLAVLGGCTNSGDITFDDVIGEINIGGGDLDPESPCWKPVITLQDETSSWSSDDDNWPDLESGKTYTATVSIRTFSDYRGNEQCTGDPPPGPLQYQWLQGYYDGTELTPVSGDQQRSIRFDPPEEEDSARIAVIVTGSDGRYSDAILSVVVDATSGEAEDEE